MRSLTFVLCGALVVACHAVLPLEPQPDTQGGDVEHRDSGRDLGLKDLPDGAVVDAPLDLAPPDLTPDVWPHFDGPSGDGHSLVTPCKTLWASPELQISRTESITVLEPAGQPSITFHDGKFYVAFVESGKIHVRGITVFATTGNNVPTKIAAVPLPGDNLSKEAGEPWITAGPSGKLGLVWTEKQKAAIQKCGRRLLYANVATGTNPSPGPTTCVLSANHPQHGYNRPQLIYDDGELTVAARVDYNANATSQVNCRAHAKALIYSFVPPAGCPASFTGSGYNLSNTSTQELVIATTSAAGILPYQMVRVWNADGNLSDINAYHQESNVLQGWGWGALPSNGMLLGPTGLTRPALVVAGSAVWMAWTVPNNNALNIRYQDPNATSRTFATDKITSAAEPALAHNTTLKQTALVYTDSAANSIQIALLTKATAAIQQVVYPSAAVGIATNPGSPVLAAGAGGFGVAWVHAESGKVPEVYFSWVGCLKSP